MINVDDVIAKIDRNVGGQSLTQEDWREIRHTIIHLNNRVVQFERIAAQDAAAMKKGIYLFKRAKGWPAQPTPTLAELLTWLIDRSQIEKSLFYKGVLEKLAVKLKELGEMDFTRDYKISGAWLIDLNVTVINALAIDRPAVEGEESVVIQSR